MSETVNADAIGLSPSDVRRRILAEHDFLRGLAADAAAEAGRVLHGGGDPAALPARARLLARELALHLATEEEILVPILFRIDAWGPVRVAQMHAEHTRQLEELRRLAEETNGTSPARIAMDVRRFVGDLMHDMRREEHDMLHPDLLRDDIVSIDQSDG
jgi:iron-sulfur cluster repair protein YtfE (RIC family)